MRDGSIQVLSELTDRSEIFSFLEKAIFPDRETLERRYREDWTSIGIIEIELLKFYPQIRTRNWEQDKPYIRQSNLYAKIKPLEQVPFEMRLKFRCKNNTECKTHESMLIGWQYMEAFRQFRLKYGSADAAFAAIKNKLSNSFADPQKRAFALLGTHHRWGSWMVAELFFFDRHIPRSLF